jgi:hypothetical protein
MMEHESKTIGHERLDHHLELRGIALPQLIQRVGGRTCRGKSLNSE